MRERNAKFHSKQHRQQISRRAQRVDAVGFFNLLTGPELLKVTEAHLPEHRERLYPPTVALSMFMRQALDADGSCQKAVNGWAAQRRAEGLSVQSVRTGAYCKARERLPVPMVTGLTQAVGELISARAKAGWRWRGRHVKLVDGTGISMPDTPENQACYPQPSSQAAGVGFPLARVVGVICLATGAVIDAAIGPQAGKGNSELGLLRTLGAAFSPGDVMLADALYCNYFLVATMLAAGVDVLFEQNGARHTDFRRGVSLGARDHLVRWTKSKTRPEWMSAEQYAEFPDALTVREVMVDGQILVTTLLNPRQVRKNALDRLYAQRWNVELDLRNIKTTLGVDVLRCLTPRMVEKELWVHLLAYNLIRLLMAQAALDASVHPRQLSFKHTVQLWTEWTTHRVDLGADPDTLFRLIAQLTVGNRPGRIEPRARKRRPKPYPWLKMPRAEAREQVRRYGHL
ncbi:IS4 family transposase [Acidiferrobacter sp. SPIII_3]|uniref:IS4 family transposase n=1 Tax=Acidiferrobacter sp. SPIII_3 TaxID=1281578 RepID=UPI000D73A339|nr:IS4 family transposase [Acidiferrobacter sp. SPIII_3]AWP21948.1 IS4 family transposase [Acidiferrobacter sp. SPIII_3]AWP22190.1 IS4 family transposase [Acidiferrobacter sp. SPIII_3]AWP23197.1 IS4 family transposase [Acidiferrobacter sp. SPIII_3]